MLISCKVGAESIENMNYEVDTMILFDLLWVEGRLQNAKYSIVELPCQNLEREYSYS